MSDKEKKNAIPAEGTVAEAKPETKEGFFQKIGRKAKQFAAKPAVKKVAKIGLNLLIGTGLVGLGWAMHDVAGGEEADEEDQVMLTGGELEESSEEETEANNE